MSQIPMEYEEVLIPAGKEFTNAVITGYGVRFLDKKINEIDGGGRSAKFGEFEVLSVVDRTKEDTAPYLKYKIIDGFEVKIGTVAKIRLLKDVKNLVPKRVIISGGGNWTPQNNTTLQSQNAKVSDGFKICLSKKNIIIGLVSIGIVAAILKWNKFI